MTATQQPATEQPATEQPAKPVTRWARTKRTLSHWNEVLAGI